MEGSQPLAFPSSVSKPPIAGHRVAPVTASIFNSPVALLPFPPPSLTRQERLLDHLVIFSCHHDPEHPDLILGSGFGPASEARESRLTANHSSTPRLISRAPVTQANISR